MTKKEITITETRVTRILLDVDAWGTSAALMESAVLLAARLEAEICGLFVEDSDLLHLATLPFTREICQSSARMRVLDPDALARHLQSEAENLRQKMSELASVSSVNWSFRMMRGVRFDVVLQEYPNYELLILMPTRLYSLSRPKKDLLEYCKTVILFYDLSPQSARALHVSLLLLSNVTTAELKLLTLNEEVESEANKKLLNKKLHVNYTRIEDDSMTSIIKYIKHNPPGMMVLPFDEVRSGEPENIKALLEIISCPIILVR